MNSTEHALEMKALLAASGEAVLSERERQQTAVWTRDLEALTEHAKAAFSAGPTGELTVNHLNPAARTAIARRRFRIRQHRLVRRLAAAAALVLLIGGGFQFHVRKAEQIRLDRLGSVLFLLENADDAFLDSNLGTDRVTLESLAEQLSRLQFAQN